MCIHDTPINLCVLNVILFCKLGNGTVSAGGSDDHGEGSGDLGDEGKSHTCTCTHTHAYTHAPTHIHTHT